MPSSKSISVDNYPSILWVTVPPVLLLATYFVRKWYLARTLRLYGIGKGAPGFQTNVRRIRVTPEIAARLRRGEEVTPEEIAAASARAEEEEKREPVVEAPFSLPEKSEQTRAPTEHVNEWLPESINAPKKRSKGRKK